MMKLRSFFFGIYRKMRDLIVPGLRDSRLFYEDELISQVTPRVKWLDLGCGHKVLGPARFEDERELVLRSRMVVGVDYDLGSLVHHRAISHRIRADINSLPFKNEVFDLVSANMVIEHLERPEVQFREISRILAKQGRLLFHTPSAFGYQTILGRLVPGFFKERTIYFLQGREERDVFRTHYKANTRKSILSLARDCGFRVIKIQMRVAAAQFVMIPPILLLELLWLRALMSEKLRPLRNNIIGVLEKT